MSSFSNPHSGNSRIRPSQGSVHNRAAIAAGAVSSPLADLANEHFSLLTTKKKPVPPDPVALPHISAGKKLGFLFGFTCFLFSKRYHNIEEQSRFFWGGKVLHIEFRTTCPFLSASNEEGNHQISMLPSSLVVFLIFSMKMR